MPKKAKVEHSLAPSAPGTLADLIGNSIAIKLADGTAIIVPADKAGNRVANMVMASEIRHIMQKSIQTYRDKDMLPSPQDLKNLTSAAAELAKFSGEVYKEDDTPLPTEKKADNKPAAKPADDISFETAMPETEKK